MCELTDQSKKTRNPLPTCASQSDQHDGSTEELLLESTLYRNPKSHIITTTRPPNAYRSASLLSRLFFTWPYPLLKKGLDRPLTDADLPDIEDIDSSKNALAHFHKLWEREQAKALKNGGRQPSLRRAILWDFLTSVWYAQPLMLCSVIAKVVQALALGELITVFQDDHGDDITAASSSSSSSSSSDGYQWAAVLVACSLVLLFEHHHLFFATWRKGMQIRIACLAAVYDKSLKLSNYYHANANVLNLASNDIERFLMAALFLNYLIWAPIQSIAVLIVGYWFLGIAFVAGFGLLLLVFIPLQFYLGSMFAHYRSQIAKLTDRRVTFIGQAVRGARVMKLSGYEDLFLHRIQCLREMEMAQVTRANGLKCWNESLFFATNVVISLVIFVVHVQWCGKTLIEGDVYTVFVLINVLQLEMTKHFSIAVMAVSECYVSIGRIQEFIEAPVLPVNSITDTNRPTDSLNATIVIGLDHVECRWNYQKQLKAQSPTKANDKKSVEATTNNDALLPIALSDITIQFLKGALTAVIGPVGAGKSALLQAIVGELPIYSGAIERNYRSISYAAQDPWIMDGSVRDNILMGLDYNEEWYGKVVDSCSLRTDLELFPFGDGTLLGENGVQCSGGQRARIGLARAIYRDADVLVADDPLSAVDAKVGRHMFREAILGLVVHRGKSVVMATHQHQHIHDTKCVLIMNGRVQLEGSYSECVEASGGKLKSHAVEGDPQDENIVAVNELINDKEPLLMTEKLQEQLALDRADHKEINVEGHVQFGTYVNYMKAMGGIWVGVFLFALFTVTQGSVLVTIATIGKWAAKSPDEQKDWRLIGIIFGMAGSVLVLGLIRAFLCFWFTIAASKRLHNQMTRAVLRAKVQFFDTNPLGRILNRFSADVGITDDQLPHTLYDFSMLAFIVLGALATTVSTLPFVLVAIPFLGWYFASARKIFVISSRELKRIEGLSRSPIFAMLGESLNGISTIRPNNAVDFFKEKFRLAHDAHSRSFFSFIASSRWVGFRMDSLLFLFVTFVSFLSVLFHQRKWFNVDPSVLGLSLSVLLQLASLFQWCVRQSAEVVNQMVSVERVLAFRDLTSEAELMKESDKMFLAAGWPQKGSIHVTDLCIRYRPSLPLALDKVSFSIPGGSRVGIVGRTGSGKSTIVQSLFRLIEAEAGSITIDGVRISDLGLHALRTKLSVIPQVPTLFSGCSIRENLDLFGIHDEKSLRHVIEACHLGQVIDDLPDGMDSKVSEGGSNFSVGQRQLLCLARAILNKNRILILDEATANVDRRTDQLLQTALKENFQDGTILAVAHRLDTIIDFDLCLVLGAGKVLEFGSPAELLRLEGAFASMVQDTGPNMAGELRRIAFETEKARSETSRLSI